MKTGFTGLTGQVDSALSVMDEMDALESLIALMGAGARSGDDQAIEGVAFLSRIIGDRLDEVKDFVGELGGVRARH